MPFRPLLVLLAVAATAAFAAPAGAGTFCVHVAGTCPATSVDEDADLQSALSDAVKSPGEDVVQIGAGTYPGAFFYLSAQPLKIVGAGTGETILTHPPFGGVGEALFTTADVSHLRVRVPAFAGWTGIRAVGDAILDDVAVDAASGAGQRIGVTLGDTSTLRRSTVELNRASDRAVTTAPNNGTVTIEDVRAEAATVVEAISSNGTTLLRRATLLGTTGLAASGAKLEAHDAVVHAEGPAARGVVARCDDGLSASLLADHLTILGVGDTGVFSQCDGAGLKARADVRNSIIRSFQHAYRRKNPGGGSAGVSIVFSDLVAATGISEGTGSTVLSDDVDVSPDLAADGEHLAVTSPLVDAGAPGDPLERTDRDGNPRLVGGRQDIGAYELQPQPLAFNKPGTPARPPQDVVVEPASTGGAVSGTPAVAPVAVTDGALLAGLRRTIARRVGRRGVRYAHRWPVPGTLAIRWIATRGGRKVVVARGRISRTTLGVASLKVRTTGRGRTLLRSGHRLPIVVRGSFAPSGRKLVRASRRAAIRGS